jgi:hypothetical protein
LFARISFGRKGAIGQEPKPSRDEIREALSGNLCRCTGYIKIYEAVIGRSRMRGDEMELPRESLYGTNRNWPRMNADTGFEMNSGVIRFNSQISAFSFQI